MTELHRKLGSGGQPALGFCAHSRLRIACASTCKLLRIDLAALCLEPGVLSPRRTRARSSARMLCGISPEVRCDRARCTVARRSELDRFDIAYDCDPGIETDGQGLILHSGWLFPSGWLFGDVGPPTRHLPVRTAKAPEAIFGLRGSRFPRISPSALRDHPQTISEASDAALSSGWPSTSAVIAMLACSS